MKKRWKKPQLIVLIRGHPEESVLLFCKVTEIGSEGPQNYIYRCFIDESYSLCQSWTWS